MTTQTAGAAFKRGNTEIKEKGIVTGVINNEAFNTQENFNMGSNNSTDYKAAATEDLQSN